MNYLNNMYVHQIFNVIQDGIIIMDENRKILTMNPSAKEMTGWELHHRVPYCLYCESRDLRDGENKCYLIEKEEVPYILSEMPTYKDEKISVEMSTAVISPDKEKKEYLLVLRDHSLREKEEQVRLSKQMIQMLIETKEKEQKRLAQELHDGVGQSLYSISIALQAIESYVQDPTLLNYIDEVRGELEQVINDVKSHAYQLRPQILDRLGLVATLHEMVKSLEKGHKEITFTVQTNLNNETLSSAITINLYRVIQEAVLNSIKHAKATTIDIRLIANKKETTLQIKDNGIGFKQEGLTHSGLGLKHMEERIHQIGGQFQIRSIPNEGTIVFAKLAKGGIYDDKGNGSR